MKVGGEAGGVRAVKAAARPLGILVCRCRRPGVFAAEIEDGGGFRRSHTPPQPPRVCDWSTGPTLA